MSLAALSADLLRTVDKAEEVLRRVGAEESRQPALAGGWSRRQVIGHLIDSASNNHQRFVRASLQGALDFPAYDQNEWAQMQAADHVDWPLLVELWASYNRYLAHVIARMPAAKLDAPVRIGPNEPITLKFLAEDYLRHMVHHLEQVGAAPKDE